MYSFDSRVRYSEVDSDEKMTLLSILNYFQDCSTFHSEDLGVGINYLKGIECGWVLSYWQIDINRYPLVCEKIKVGTAPYEFRGFLGSRNFVLMDEEGKIAACANSLWSFLDLKTGRPTRVPESVQQAYTLEEKLNMEYEARKIVISGDGDEKEQFCIEREHIDSNHHVNNGQYVQMAMRYLPENFKICRMRAEYKKAALLHDMISPIIYKDKKKVIVKLADANEEAFAIVEFKEE